MNGHGTIERGDLLTLSEAADKLKLKVSTLRAWVLRRRIPYVKLGRLVRMRRADIEALIATSVVPAAPLEKRGGQS